MISTFLDIIGLLLIVLAAGVAIGLGAAILAAGVCCLVLSWSMSRTTGRKR